MGRQTVIDEVGALIGALNPVVASDADLLDELAAVQRLCAIAEARRLAYLREVEARRLYRVEGGAHPVPWAADWLKVSQVSVGRWRRLARALAVLPLIKEAFDTGRITAEQAQIMADTVAVLPVSERAAAERVILARGADHGPERLRVTVREFLEEVDPLGTQQRDETAAARAEARAEAKAGLTIYRIEGTNLARIEGYLDLAMAAPSLAALEALCAPRNRTALGLPLEVPDTRTAARRRHDAWCELGNRSQAVGDLPDHGGDRPQVVVTVRLATLKDGLHGLGYLDDGTALTPAAARLMACDALVLPVVMNGRSMPLDLGRARRLFSGPVRRALTIRDGGCTFPACDRHHSWCEAHHCRPWHDGGPSDLTNAALVCTVHHRLLHHSDWKVRINRRDGLPEYFAPGDPTPRRNHYHRRP